MLQKRIQEKERLMRFKDTIQKKEELSKKQKEKNNKVNNCTLRSDVNPPHLSRLNHPRDLIDKGPLFMIKLNERINDSFPSKAYSSIDIT